MARTSSISPSTSSRTRRRRSGLWCDRRLTARKYSGGGNISQMAGPSCSQRVANQGDSGYNRHEAQHERTAARSARNRPIRTSERMTGQTQQFGLGLTYWPRRTAFGWWQAFDRGEAREELAHVAALGCDTVRFCLRWEDFQPGRSRANSAALDAF